MLYYNVLHLFSGIGGFSLGAEWAGMEFENHFFSEIDPYAIKVYLKNFPDAINLGDITKIDGKELKEKYGDNWILTGGFPCQDISGAGKGEGITGERSILWFDYRRLIRDLRPRFAIVENVGMFVRRGLREVLGSLAEIGYNAVWQDIRAEDMGAPHKRERFIVVTYPSESGRESRIQDTEREAGNIPGRVCRALSNSPGSR
ncbi:MAG: DNA (cytosine-5-)-methyltransferase [bacterium]|nr:DNA (cytosine-5-)-methyltransferase [bacterium]